MSAVTDFKLVAETLLGKTLTAAQLTRMANAFLSAGRHGIRLPLQIGAEFEIADRSNPTAEEKAAYCLSVLRWFGREVARRNARHLANKAAQQQARADEQAAAADFEESP
jgi:hypothetical protein